MLLILDFAELLRMGYNINDIRASWLKSCKDRHYLPVGCLALYRVQVYRRKSAPPVLGKQYFDCIDTFQKTSQAQPDGTMTNESILAQHMLKRMEESARQLCGNTDASAPSSPMTQNQFDEMLNNSVRFQNMANDISILSTELSQLSWEIASTSCTPSTAPYMRPP